MLYVECEKEHWKRVILNNKIYTQYEVSTLGRIRNTNTGHILSPRDHSNGYLQVGIYHNGTGSNYYIHRLVLLAFNYIDGCENLQVNHIDGDKHHNALYNLEWCTNSENQIHAYKIGLKRHLYGEDKGRAKYTNSEIYKIAYLMSIGTPNNELTKMFNITDDELLSDIRHKRRWVEVTKDFTFDRVDQSGENNPSAKIKENDVIIICECLMNGMRPVDIYRKYGYSKDIIRHIKHRNTWTNISKKYSF